MARKVARASTAEAAALRMVSGREATEARLAAKLTTRGFSESDVSEVVAHMKALGYVDDARAARSVIRAALDAGKTPAWARQKLLDEGVAPSTVDQALRESLAERPFDAVAAAQGLLQRRKATGLRAARLLASRGFGEAVIRRVVPSIDDADGDG